MQPHLGKCFEGINKVTFEKDLKITNMISAEGEKVAMDTPVDPETPANKGNVKVFSLSYESIQWDSLRTLTVASLAEYVRVDRSQWILELACASDSGRFHIVYWTTEVTEALKIGTPESVAACRDKLTDQLKDIVKLVEEDLNKLAET